MSDDDKQTNNGTSPDAANAQFAMLQERGLIRPYFYEAETAKFVDDKGEYFEFEFHPRQRKFITSEGVELEFRKINLQTVADYGMAYRKKYKPEMPQKAVEYAEGEYYLESNPHDEGYQDKLADYENDLQMETTAYQVSLSIRNKVPDRKNWPDELKTLISSYEELGSPLSEHRIKYEWIHLLMGDNTEMVAFLHILQGSQLPTREGIQSAQERFPGGSGA